MSRDFVWSDAGRTVVLRHGGVGAAVEVLAEHGFAEFALLTTERALAGAGALAGTAGAVHTVGPGQVPDLAAELLDSNALLVGMRQEVRSSAEERVAAPLVALGGGRVIDTAKAVASVTGAAVAAIPTTMSGAEMTAIHRLPAGAEDRVGAMVRPRLVVADPEAMTSQPEAKLRASSMNALAHGADSLYTPFANPVAELTALRGAAAIAAALDAEPAARDRDELALGSLLCGYAIDSARFGLHHVVCQTLVRVCGTPHAETNAAILPVAVEFLSRQAPRPFARLAAALGTAPERLAERIRALGGEPAGLGALGGERSRLPAALDAMLRRSELAYVPAPPDRAALAALLDAAW